MPTCPPAAAEVLRQRLLTPGALWYRIETVESTGSTNADVAAWAREGAASGAVLISDHQAAGRGRFDRTWEAPPGTSISMSALLHPRIDPERWNWMSLVAGMAVADALRGFGIGAALKWPNDVLVGDRKICGILSERVDTARGAAAVVGMGINVSQDRAELPVETATSARLEGCEAGRDDIVTAVLDRLAHHYLRWMGRLDIAADYAERCATIGREVRVLIGEHHSVEGLGVGVDSMGRLLVRTRRGEQAFAAGDVQHLR